MTRVPLAILLLVVTSPLFAQYGDLTLTMDTPKTDVVSGELLDLTVTIVNHGGEASFLNFYVTVEGSQQFVTATPPPSWTCAPGTPDMLACSAEKLEAGATSAFPVRVHVANNRNDGTFEIAASVSVGGSDDSYGDNTAQRTIHVAQAPATTALSIHANPTIGSVVPGQPATVTLDVRNDGPDAATEVVVRAFYARELTATLQGAGWTCDARSCTRALIGSGQSAPLTFSLPTSTETVYPLYFTVGAELSFDPNGTDNGVQVQIGVGDALSWRRILLPLSFGETPGAYGSLWKTEIKGHFDGDAYIQIEPRRICPRPTQCVNIQPHRPFDVPGAVSIWNLLPAQFVYVRAEYEPQLTLNLRVRDMTRTAETWGTEVPVVRESEWRTGSIVLAPLPVDPLFRLTLRAYDYDSIATHRIAIRIYADNETEPRVTLERMFATQTWPVTTAFLPGFPGYIQLDPLAEAGEAMAGAKTMWIRISPLTPNMRYWAFASVTNNPTGHVTTVTPQ